MAEKTALDRNTDAGHNLAETFYLVMSMGFLVATLVIFLAMFMKPYCLVEPSLHIRIVEIVLTLVTICCGIYVLRHKLF